MEWPNDIVLSFISEVKRLTVLWDTTDPFYKILRRKKNVWVNLGAKFNTTSYEVKKKWQSLQASYRREKIKEITEKIVSKWFAYEAMTFLGDRYKPRNTRNTLQISKMIQECESESTEGYCEHEDVNEGIEDVAAFEMEGNSSSNIPSRKMKLKPNMSLKFIPQKKIRDDNGKSKAYNILKTAAVENLNEGDENEIYGKYVASTLKKLDNHSRIVAKHYINQILFDAELGRYRNSFTEESPIYYSKSRRLQRSHYSGSSSIESFSHDPSPSHD